MILQTLLFPIRVIAAIIGVGESTLKIIKQTLTFLIKQIEYEVLNQIQDGKDKNETDSR